MSGYRIPGGPYPQAFFGVSWFPPYESGELPGAEQNLVSMFRRMLGPSLPEQSLP